MFVSACYLLVDIARGELRYVNAGHPTPLCVHRALRSAEPLPLADRSLCADELCKQLVDEVQQFAATKDFADDVCLIAMEIDHLMKD
jgi:serine phosphatase RsbU (regulator of sigma subunit)